MKYRNFKGRKLAEVGLGTWQLGSADWGRIDEEKAHSILEAYIDAGGNFLDTADVYGLGISESVIGNFMKSQDQEIFVATKLGRRHDGANGWNQNFSYDLMRAHVEESLKHLGIDHLFLEQLHCIPFEILKEQKVFDHLRRLQQEGLIENWGVSVETSEEALFCLQQEGISSIQIIFNLFRQHVADEVFPLAKQNSVAIIARVPLASGLLSGKFSTATQFEKTDHRNYNKDGQAFNVGETFSGVEFEKGVGFSKQMALMLPDQPLAQSSLRWILDHPEVTTVIPGASSISQVKTNVDASSLSNLAEETHRELRKFYNDHILSQIRGQY